ncbi:uncharacterized protein DS421_15g500500 [Arachis hypogaea]|nr:uncharacterized protein DS421_15g500500 [Arachis hypogaea]
MMVPSPGDGRNQLLLLIAFWSSPMAVIDLAATGVTMRKMEEPTAAIVAGTNGDGNGPSAAVTAHAVAARGDDGDADLHNDDGTGRDGSSLLLVLALFLSLSSTATLGRQHAFGSGETKTRGFTDGEARRRRGTVLSPLLFFLPS